MKNQSVMSHNFASVPKVEISRSSFDRSHGHKTTFDAGYLVPIFLDEALPGDTFNLNMTGFARMATPIKPMMDNVYMETFFFAVPNRLVWENWEKFMGNETESTSGTKYSVPHSTLHPGQGDTEGLHDYLGIPIYSDANVVFQSLPLRAYNLIWNEWFRDQNLQTEAIVALGDDGDEFLNYNLLRRGKRHDYFTSCLPWPQKGEAVTIPMLDVLDVTRATTGAQVPNFSLGGVAVQLQSTNSTAEIHADTSVGSIETLKWGNADIGLEVDLRNATATSINDLRIAFQLQKMLERDARGGTRYPEVIHAHFGVTSPDARLQRPEYLGGGSTRVNINPVEQKGETATTPQGNLAAYATANLGGHGFTKSFTEHTIIIGLINVRADLTYQEGLNRMWKRIDRYSYFWPSFQHIGEQIVYGDEIYASSDNDLEPVFGYQEKYAEYRYKPSMITGKFCSNYSQSLDIWHLSQDFGATPKLNDSFIEDNPPIDRVIAIPSEPHFLLDTYFKYRCARPMPLYGVPGNIDRF